MTNQNKNIVFYDGDCGFCHNWVKFVLPRDKKQNFQFAPLQGETYHNTFTAEERKEHPDTVVIKTTDNQNLIYTAGVIYTLRNLSCFWRFIGILLFLSPRPLRDVGYKYFAKIRHKFFDRPDDVCPLVPEEYKNRFLE